MEKMTTMKRNPKESLINSKWIHQYENPYQETWRHRAANKWTQESTPLSTFWEGKPLLTQISVKISFSKILLFHCFLFSSQVSTRGRQRFWRKMNTTMFTSVEPLWSVCVLPSWHLFSPEKILTGLCPFFMSSSHPRKMFSQTTLTSWLPPTASTSTDQRSWG